MVCTNFPDFTLVVPPTEMTSAGGTGKSEQCAPLIVMLSKDILILNDEGTEDRVDQRGRGHLVDVTSLQRLYDFIVNHAGFTVTYPFAVAVLLTAFEEECP